MDKAEALEKILRRVRSVPLDPQKIFRIKSLGGSHKSKNVGHGFDFVQHAPFEDAEDERFIDWHVLARTGEKMIKRFRQESDIPIFILLDLTANMFLGTQLFFDFCTLKSEAALIVAAAFRETALELRDPLGYLLVDSEGKNALFEPKKGLGSWAGLETAWSIIWEREKRQDASGWPPTFLSALESLTSRLNRQMLLVIISDFQETFSPEIMNRYLAALRRLENSHTLAVIAVRTPWEYACPESRSPTFFRSGNSFLKFHAGSQRERELYNRITTGNREQLEVFFRGLAIPHAFLKTDDGIISDLEKNLTI